MLVDLILIVCLAGSPADCKMVRPGYVPPTTMHTCLMYGQKAAAEYQDRHPGTRVGWRCQMPGA